MIFLREMELSGPSGPFPFNSPQVCTLGKRRFTAPVTLLVGENGTGKSTLLEAIARKLALSALGREDAGADPSLAALAPLCKQLKLVWAARPSRSFFLRAEDFFGFTQRVEGMQAYMREELARVREEYKDRSPTAQGYAAMPFAGSLHELNARYGEQPDARSHGEAFLQVFKTRILPGGLYLLDEPEAALSPMRQMALLSLLMDMAGTSQFLIATHSPLLMACPGAAVWSFDESPVREVAWQDTEHVRVTRDFLASPQRYLRHLHSAADEGDASR